MLIALPCCVGHARLVAAYDGYLSSDTDSSGISSRADGHVLDDVRTLRDETRTTLDGFGVFSR